MHTSQIDSHQKNKKQKQNQITANTEDDIEKGKHI